MENLDLLVLELCKLPKETTWVEFKHNNDDPKMIGEDISALANSTVIADRSYAYMIWGVEDGTHEIVGTTVRLPLAKKGNQELENWLRYLLSKNADFEFKSVEIDGKHIEIIIISRAVGAPVSFEKSDYIRIGSYTKKLNEFVNIQAQLWDKLRNNQFEDILAVTDLKPEDVFRLIDSDSYFNLLNRPFPLDTASRIHYLIEDNIVTKQDNGLYAITNLGALLFARRLSDFQRLGRKAIRIVQYEGKGRLAIQREQIFEEGYAISLEKSISFIKLLIPSSEDINAIKRTNISSIPVPAIREAIANSLIHQDFFVTGSGPVIEIFGNRIEITNPGVPLIEIKRIIDNPPKSRNEKLASSMRRLGMCEELGRGWDRMVISCELQYLPAPQIKIYPDSTRVTLFSHFDFANIPLEDKVWSAYLHACIKYVENDVLTNMSLRERFGLKESSSGMVSRLIKETLSNNLIKAVDPTTAPRYMKYIPIWA